MSKLLLVTLCVLATIHAEVIPFDNSAIEKIFQEKKAAVFLFTSSNEASTAAKAAFTEYDEAGSNVILTNSDSEDGKVCVTVPGRFMLALFLEKIFKFFNVMLHLKLNAVPCSILRF